MMVVLFSCHAATETGFDALDDHFAWQQESVDSMFHLGCLRAGFGVGEGKLLYLQGTYQAFACLGVGVVVQLDIRGQPLC